MADVALGPVQLLVVAFDRPDFDGAVLAELERLRESDVVRVIDLLVVHKGADGEVRRLHQPDPSEGAGTVVGALIGLDAPPGEADGSHAAAEDDLWSLDEAIPNDSAAAIALIEHRWAIGARAAAGLIALAERMGPALQAAGVS